jgi:hypothetical protein
MIVSFWAASTLSVFLESWFWMICKLSLLKNRPENIRQKTWSSPKWPFLWHFSVCHPFVLQNCGKAFESRYNLVLIRLVEFLESKELAGLLLDDETAFPPNNPPSFWIRCNNCPDGARDAVEFNKSKLLETPVGQLYALLPYQQQQQQPQLSLQLRSRRFNRSMALTIWQMKRNSRSYISPMISAICKQIPAFQTILKQTNNTSNPILYSLEEQQYYY